MAKMNEASLKKTEEEKTTKQQVATTAPAAQPIAPAKYLDELDHFREAAVPNLRQYLLGTLLKFKKGDWIYGETELPEGTRLIALMNHAHHGWLKWNDDKTATQIVGSIVAGFKPPGRKELGDLDEVLWKIGLSGKKEDPWQEVVYLPFLSLDGETLLTFSTTTKTGRPQVWKLIDRYAWIGRKHLNAYPVVELQVGGFENQFGWIKTPKFEIVDWVDRPDITPLIGSSGSDDGGDAQPELLRKDEMDDEIGF